jgi:hypothetical protein
MWWAIRLAQAFQPSTDAGDLGVNNVVEASNIPLRMMEVIAVDIRARSRPNNCVSRCTSGFPVTALEARDPEDRSW